MSARRPLLWMLPVVALIGFVSTSAAWLDSFTSPTPVEFQRNFERWIDLSDGERRVVLERWEEWQSLDVEQQDLLKTRMLTLMRVRASYAGASDVDDVSQASLSGEVERLVSLAKRSVEELDADPTDVRRALNRRSRKLAMAYVDDLIALGRIAPERRAQFEELDAQALVSRALLLAKDEAVAAARAAPGDEPLTDPEELEVLEPLDVIQRVERMRALFGFHGPIGRVVHERMDDDARARLREASEAGRERDVHALLVPYVREIALERGLSPERIDLLVTMPRGAIERHLNALLVPR